MEKKLTKEEQLQLTKQIYDVLTKLQEEVPGKHYVVFSDIKTVLAQVNNSIGAELKENTPQIAEVLPGAEEVHVTN